MSEGDADRTRGIGELVATEPTVRTLRRYDEIGLPVSLGGPMAGADETQRHVRARRLTG